eukprot:jgi/Chlat1/3199/Chrsp22S03483
MQRSAARAKAPAGSTELESKLASPRKDTLDPTDENSAVLQSRRRQAEAASKLAQQVKDVVLEANLQTLLHPTLISLAGVLLTWLLVRVGLGLAAAIVVVVPLTVWSQLLFMTRRLRQELLQRLDEYEHPLQPDHESTEWINHLLTLVWQNYSVFIAAELVKTLTPKLQDTKSELVPHVGIQRLDIGTRPPRLGNFKVYREDPRKFMMDFDVRYDGDLSCDIWARPVSSPVPLTVRVSDPVLHAKMRIEAELLPNTFPFVKTFALQMLEPPTIDVKVNTVGVPVTDIPGFAQLIHSLIVRNIAAILVPPNRFEIDVLEVLGEDPNEVGKRIEVARQKENIIKHTQGALSEAAAGVTGAVSDVYGLGLSTVKGVAGGIGTLGGAGLKVGGAGLNLGVSSISSVGKGIGSLFGYGSTQKQPQAGADLPGQEHQLQEGENMAQMVQDAVQGHDAEQADKATEKIDQMFSGW